MKLKPHSWLCPFCRAPGPTSDEDIIRRYEKRAEKGDKIAIFSLAEFTRSGHYGLAKDVRKSCELVHRAADLGDVYAIAALGDMHAFGIDGVSLDETKGREFLERAVKKGNTIALAKLGALEASKGRTELALTYWRTAAEAGEDEAVKCLWVEFKAGTLSKDDLEKSLRAHQKANEDRRSEERERLKRWMKAQEEKKKKKKKEQGNA